MHGAPASAFFRTATVALFAAAQVPFAAIASGPEAQVPGEEAIVPRTVPAVVGPLKDATVLRRPRGETSTTLRALRPLETVGGHTLKAKRSKKKTGTAVDPNEPPCEGFDLPARGASLPFHSGEELAYELTVAGVYLGKMEIKVGPERMIDGKPTLSLFGRARTNSFASSIKKFSARFNTLVERTTFKPVALRVESTYGEDSRWEKARFLDDNTKVASSYLMQGKEGVRDYDLDEPITDVLTVLYYARTRVIKPGDHGCQQVFGARWLWRMDASVSATDTVDTPAGKKEALLVSTTFKRTPHPDSTTNQTAQRIALEVYFAKDGAQEPLQFVIHAENITAVGKLVRWSLKDQGDEGWVF